MKKETIIAFDEMIKKYIVQELHNHKEKKYLTFDLGMSLAGNIEKNFIKNEMEDRKEKFIVLYQKIEYYIRNYISDVLNDINVDSYEYEVELLRESVIAYVDTCEAIIIGEDIEIVINDEFINKITNDLEKVSFYDCF